MLGRNSRSVYRTHITATTSLTSRPFIVNRYQTTTTTNTTTNNNVTDSNNSNSKKSENEKTILNDLLKFKKSIQKKNNDNKQEEYNNNNNNEQHKHGYKRSPFKNQNHHDDRFKHTHHHNNNHYENNNNNKSLSSEEGLEHKKQLYTNRQIDNLPKFDQNLTTYKDLLKQFENILRDQEQDNRKLLNIENKLIGKSRSADEIKTSTTVPTTTTTNEELSSSFISRSYLDSDLHPVYYTQGKYKKITNEIELIHDFKLVDYSTDLEVVEKYNYSEIPRLSHGLEKVLTEKGVHPMVNFDGSANFPKFLTDILEFNTLEIPTNYTPPSKDKRLLTHAVNSKSRFISSTSSITAVLTQLYLTLTKKKGVNIYGFSDSLLDLDDNGFIPSITKPASVHLIPLGKGIWGIDINNGNVIQQHTTLMELGHSMERMLTMEEDEFNQKILKVNNPNGPVTLPESYVFSKFKSLMYRSQIDCYSDIVGGTFDLKTRATHSIRMNSHDIPNHVGYQLRKISGEYSSYEREYYDLIKSGAIKYNFQAKIGSMAGIFVAYHNTKRIFGAEYIPVEELDRSVFWGKDMADKTFRIINNVLDDILNILVDTFDPNFTYRVTFSGGKSHRSLGIFVEKLVVNTPVDPENSLEHYELEFQVLVNDKDIQSPLHFTPTDKLDVYFRLYKYLSSDIQTSYITCLRAAKIYQEYPPK